MQNMWASASVLLLLMSMTLTSSGEWQLKKDKDGIQVYTRKADNSDVFEYKATTTLNTTDLDALVHVIFDTESYPEWIAHISEGSTIERISDTECMAYTIAKLPFPFKNRDVVSHMALHSDEQMRQIQIMGKPEYLPEKKGLVRVPEAKGFWKFELNTEGTVDVHYQFLSDPGGSIPSWVINAFIVDGPYTTLKNLRDLVK